ncbi:hypothetical protein GUJ93_ZPchr0931g38040 [Zizania palustris]|uniref:PORR domain-containing protein n=1 Tax=Zizania palustris TaxID=103762 RepID=A0A8J5QUR2_ZIZPA|nr:hypothetical protein GUJ93_ZPchr0931g38040 [Zizania palustris]
MMSTSRSLRLPTFFRVWRELTLSDDLEESVMAEHPHLFRLAVVRIRVLSPLFLTGKPLPSALTSSFPLPPPLPLPIARVVGRPLLRPNLASPWLDPALTLPPLLDLALVRPDPVPPPPLTSLSRCWHPPPSWPRAGRPRSCLQPPPLLWLWVGMPCVPPRSSLPPPLLTGSSGPEARSRATAAESDAPVATELLSLVTAADFPSSFGLGVGVPSS